MAVVILPADPVIGRATSARSLACLRKPVLVDPRTEDRHPPNADDILAGTSSRRHPPPNPAPQDLVADTGQERVTPRAPSRFCALIPSRLSRNQPDIPRNTLVAEKRTYSAVWIAERRRPPGRQRFQLTRPGPRSSNQVAHGFSRNLREKATVVIWVPSSAGDQ